MVWMMEYYGVGGQDHDGWCVVVVVLVVWWCVVVVVVVLMMNEMTLWVWRGADDVRRRMGGEYGDEDVVG